MPLGQPSYSATSDHSSVGEMRKMRPKGMSTTYRLPARSNDGPSRKLSIGSPGLFASPHSVRLLRRNESGSRVRTRASMTSGGLKSRFHIASVQLDSRIAHGRAPLRVLGAEEFRELLRRAAERRAAFVAQLLLHVLRLGRLVHL